MARRPRVRITHRDAAGALAGPATLGALGLMVLNDHVLKGLLPGWLTGKLSDFAFLFFAPIVLVFVVRARSRLAIAACYTAPAALLVAINVSPAASDAFATAMSRIVPMVLWPDPTDLVALAVLPLSHAYLVRRRSSGEVRRSLQFAVTSVAAFACMATSPRRPSQPPTHRPVYMSWEELRGSAVRVLPPQRIERRGKLLVAHEHLFVSEPGRGVHVLDNRDPRRPDPVMFIRIPGNVDIAVVDDRLYADSFVDLLTFELDLEQRTATLVGRLEDQFAYDPHQALGLDDDAQVWLDHIDWRKGVVVGIEPIGAPTPEERR